LSCEDRAGRLQAFSWEEAESGAWEDPEFLKPFEEKARKSRCKKAIKKRLI